MFGINDDPNDSYTDMTVPAEKPSSDLVMKRSSFHNKNALEDE